MAKLEYDETGRLLFTQEMRKEYTILIPQMLPVHFGFFAKLLECSTAIGDTYPFSLLCLRKFLFIYIST